MFKKLVQDHPLDLRSAVFQHALDNTTTVLVRRHLGHLTAVRVNDELDVFARDALNGLLYHVVAILILNHLHYCRRIVPIEFSDQAGLLIDQDMLKCFLYNTATVHLCGQSQNLTLHLQCESLLLRLGTMLKQLLDHVIPKKIAHELQGIRLDLFEDLFLFLAVGCLQFLLDEPRPMLVATELNHMVVDISELIPTGFVVVVKLLEQRTLVFEMLLLCLTNDESWGGRIRANVGSCGHHVRTSQRIHSH